MSVAFLFNYAYVRRLKLDLFSDKFAEETFTTVLIMAYIAETENRTGGRTELYTAQTRN